jgi:cytochrome c oxidase subunit 2
LAEEEKRPQELPKKEKAPRRGVASIIIITAFIITLLTGIIASGVQSVMGAGEAKTDEGVMVDGVREFRIRAPQWYFDPVVITVNPGDSVRFIVTSADIMHGFAINELGFNLALSPGVGVTQEVVIPSDILEGTYTMYCSIFCGIGHPYMKGTVVIGERGFEIGRVLPYVATGVMVGMFAIFLVIGRRRVA